MRLFESHLHALWWDKKYQKAIVHFNIYFRSTCHLRCKCAWYDTILGGVGTGLETLHSVDILANKLKLTESDISQIVHLQSEWLPTIWTSQKKHLSFQSEFLQLFSSSVFANIRFDSNASLFTNWTQCTLQTMYFQMQKQHMQLQLMTDNEPSWRTFFNISSML